MVRTKEAIIQDLDDCQKMILKLKAGYSPSYRGLLLHWTQRRTELKKELNMRLSRNLAFNMIMTVQNSFN